MLKTSVGLEGQIYIRLSSLFQWYVGIVDGGFVQFQVRVGRY